MYLCEVLAASCCFRTL